MIVTVSVTFGRTGLRFGTRNPIRWSMPLPKTRIAFVVPLATSAPKWGAIRP
jgi:hypothetical protein